MSEPTHVISIEDDGEYEMMDFNIPGQIASDPCWHSVEVQFKGNREIVIATLDAMVDGKPVSFRDGHGRIVIEGVPEYASIYRSGVVVYKFKP